MSSRGLSFSLGTTGQGVFIPSLPDPGAGNPYVSTTPEARQGGALAASIAGLGIETYRNEREAEALADPVNFLKDRNAAINALDASGPAKYLEEIKDIADTLSTAATPYTAATVKPWMRELAAKRAALDLDFKRTLIELKYPHPRRAMDAREIENIRDQHKRTAVASLAPPTM